MKMNKVNYLAWILSAEAVGLLSGLLSRGGIQRYSLEAVKPPLTPPAWLFPVVWTILYALMGISAARISVLAEGKQRSRTLNLYVIQLVVNFFWSLIFFNLNTYGLSLLWLSVLWGLVLAMILNMRFLDLSAAKFQIPYLIWVTFAVYLNYGVWILN